jgi:hypothetical protein
LCWLALCGCPRDPQPWICPPLQPGDLVVTELRGPQSGADANGQWLELFNATGEPIDLRGLRLTIQLLSGSGASTILVRAPELTVEPGDYVVLGHHDPERAPAFVDYAFLSDYFTTSTSDDGETTARPKDLPLDGVVEVYGCDGLVDRLVYRDLPELGTWSLDGSMIPAADLNDDPTLWCIDNQTGADAAQFGLPGTPGEPNLSCT